MPQPPDAPETDRLPFTIEAFGPFPPDRLTVLYSPTPRPTTPDLDALIEAEWTRQLALAHGTSRLLFNGNLFRYLAHEISDTPPGPNFTLTVGPTCYKDFVGTNLFNRHRLHEFGWHRFANPVGTTATLITADDLIIYGRRSPRVSYHAGHVHTFGGALEEADRAPDGRIDPFASLLRELHEELALRPDEVRDLACVGLIRDKEIHQPELLFESRLPLTAAEVTRLWHTAESRDEHQSLVTLPNAPDAVLPFIRSCGPIAPVAIGALLLHGRLAWGDPWFQAAAQAYTPAQPPSR